MQAAKGFYRPSPNKPELSVKPQDSQASEKNSRVKSCVLTLLGHDKAEALNLENWHTRTNLTNLPSTPVTRVGSTIAAAAMMTLLLPLFPDSQSIPVQ